MNALSSRIVMAAALQNFLADPHPVMPDMSLTRQEIRDLVAYIGSLN